jgi:predicted PurR-regulated permease PerM
MNTSTPSPSKKIPFSLNAPIFCMGLLALVYLLHISQAIVVPIIYSLLLAVMLNPLMNFFLRLGLGRAVSVTITLLIAIIVTSGICFFLISQANLFSESVPKLADKMQDLLHELISWISQTFHVSTDNVNQWITKTKTDLLNHSGAAIGQTLTTVGGVMIVVFLIPVYIFMILYYQPLLMEFFRQLFGKNNFTDVSEILGQIKTIIQNYLVGLLIEAVIVATLNSIALLAIGIEYAILFGVIGAILNVIPYIGGIIAVALPMFMALASEETLTAPLLVLIAYIVIQFIDNHYIIPKIVASKVKLNALVSIVVVLAGDALWGIPGMFLSIPLTAVIKVIFDRWDSLKPWGYLLGDVMPGEGNKEDRKKRIRHSQVK